MDPRPNDFSYRRQRPDNLTYISYGASESLFHVRAYNKQLHLARSGFASPTDQSTQQATRQTRWNNLSLSPYNPQSVTVNPLYMMHKHNDNKSSIYNAENSRRQNMVNNDRSNLSKSMIVTPQNYTSYFDKISSKRQLVNPVPSFSLNHKDSLSQWVSVIGKRKSRQGQDQVFQLQQKPYNILSLTPKQRPDEHRPYPKYSLENQLISKNMMPKIS